ncbi:unnamed protein product [Darwinula stevensoni]|uniref:Uncharacterized protein n=1 Tax=Darwinula stevensoni TaxID=69355 RepID=A0A7R8X3L0_9CRUS|nr:unnamed protein product [Darwinula stevensoni]CAG0878688.1 unnamed protein product [Darwinula stevensoni]
MPTLGPHGANIVPQHSRSANVSHLYPMWAQRELLHGENEGNSKLVEEEDVVKGEISTGVIIGILVGVVFLLAIAVDLFCYWKFQRGLTSHFFGKGNPKHGSGEPKKGENVENGKGEDEPLQDRRTTS